MKLQIALVAALILMTWLYMGKRDELAAAIEACNTDKMASIAEAEKITRKATTSALESRIQQLESTALSAQKARDIAVEARIDAENKPERVRTVYQRIIDEDACAAVAFNPDLLRCLRAGTDCGEARAGAGADSL
jgi:hypothetical protein